MGHASLAAQTARSSLQQFGILQRYLVVAREVHLRADARPTAVEYVPIRTAVSRKPQKLPSLPASNLPSKHSFKMGTRACKTWVATAPRPTFDPRVSALRPASWTITNCGCSRNKGARRSPQKLRCCKMRLFFMPSCRAAAIPAEVPTQNFSCRLRLLLFLHVGASRSRLLHRSTEEQPADAISSFPSSGSS